jgi:hypothetical protein
VFLDGRNLSALLAGAGLAAENLGRFGEGGFPAPAAEVREAAARAGPLPFEPPHAYRARMREVARDLRARGLYPGGGAGEPAAR